MIKVKRLKTIFIFAISIAVFLTLQACAGMQLTPKSADPSEIKGTYTLILYGCKYTSDIENMAILVDDNSEYPVDIYDIDGMYKTKKGLSGSQALSEANTFIKCSSYTFWSTVLRRISVNGRTIAYELKPLYRSLDFGVPEVLLSTYSLKNSKVSAYIRLDNSVYQLIHGGGGSDGGGGMGQ
jgi:hypothetical protein